MTIALETLVGTANDAAFSAALGIPPRKLGQVATRCGQLPTNVYASVTQGECMTMHRAMDNITTLRVVTGNFYVNPTAGEVLTGRGTQTEKLSVEYPLGTAPKVFLWSGSKTIDIATGQLATSDAVSITIPQGAYFKIKRRVVSAAGIAFAGGGANWVGSGEGVYYGTSIADSTETSGGLAGSSGATFIFGPMALLAPTRRPSVAVISTSRDGGGSMNAGDVNHAFGEVLPTVEDNFGTINLGVPSDSMQGYLLGNTNRTQLANLCGSILLSHGINDVRGNRTAAQITADAASILALFPSHKDRAVTTMTPYSQDSATSGKFTTTATQTPFTTATETARVGYNTNVRAGAIAGMTATFDIAQIFESGYNSGAWTNLNGNPITGDGLHANELGNKMMRHSGVVRPSVFFK